jgi:SAM-dependent methyltransferase
VTEQAWLPHGVDAHTPTDARVHDYALGGKDNYAVDRRYAQKLLAALPAVSRPAVENRKFTQRAIRSLLSSGVRQFLEIGCGLPRRPDVHDMTGPEARVVYVDYDPVAVTHFQAVLSGNGSAAAIHADATRPGQILSHPVVTEFIDFEQPVGLLMTYLFHLITDEDDPARILREFREALAPGSHLVLSHATHEGMSPAQAEALYELFEELREPVTLRDRDEIGRLFDGFELLDPGLVFAPEWRPDRPYRTPTGMVLAGVGRKR